MFSSDWSVADGPGKLTKCELGVPLLRVSPKLQDNEIHMETEPTADQRSVKRYRIFSPFVTAK